MRVALVCPYAWDRAGGVQVHVANLATSLRGRGHEVAVLTPADGPVRDAGVHRIGQPMAVRYQGTVAPVAPSPLAMRPLRHAIRSFAPDVLHVHEPFAPSTSMFAVLAAPPRLAVVATFHAYAARSRLLTAAAPALRALWRRLDVRIAVSDAASSFIRARFRGDVRIIPNGVDTRAFAEAGPALDVPAGRRIQWVARLEPKKGFGIALSAMQILRRDVPDAVLVVAGDGADAGLAERLAVDAGDAVRMLGAVAHEAVPSYLAAADAFVSPAVAQESFGITLVEAMAAGVPVVATDIPGYREVVRDGIDGVLVPPGDPAALARALRSVLIDGDLAPRLREAGRARAERFSWTVVTEEIERAYTDAIAARAIASPGPACL